jgi:protein CpxP
MKKLILACCLFLGLATASFGQTVTPPSDPQQRAKALQKELKLSDDQTSKIAAIYQDSAQKFDVIKKKEHGDTNKMLGDVAPLRKETVAKIKALLNSRQAEKYNTLISENKSSLQGGWSGGWS